ncbi:MAG TPA: hypothetical protein VL588_02050 [Bdellovibrionota bacterium]|nr:hypothetical protein [Bdellovibrionota bacterium]
MKRKDPRLHILYVSLLTSAAGLLADCARSGVMVHPGQGTEADVRSLKGAPLSVVEGGKIRNGARVLTYADGTSFQVEGETSAVVVANRDPEPFERDIQYWKHHWADHHPVTTPIASTKDRHGHVLHQFLARDIKTFVVYDRSTGIVQRVVEYGR